MWQSISIEHFVHCPCAVSVPTCRDRNDGRKSDKVRQAARISASEPQKEAQINGSTLFWQGKFLSGNVLGAERVKCVNEHKASYCFMFTLCSDLPGRYSEPVNMKSDTGFSVSYGEFHYINVQAITCYGVIAALMCQGAGFPERERQRNRTS
jgi:hypothetical protein